jgi:ribosomal protein S12 methylthiotransferase accessory factor
VAEPLESIAKRLRRVVDERAGVIGELRRLPVPEAFAGVVSGYSASVGRPNDLHPDGVRMIDSSVAGYGTAVVPAMAEIRALAEALERYCSLMPPPSADVLQATADQLGADALDLTTLPRCSDDERSRSAPHTRLREAGVHAVMPWVRGYSLTRGRHVWVPLTAVYLGLPTPLDEHIAFPISTGFAAGIDYEQAILAAALEVVERDSLALWWLQQLPFPRLHPDAWQEPGTQTITSKLEAFGLRTTMFDLTTDVGVPVIGLVLEADRSFPRLVAMAACRPSPQAASLRVLEEAASLSTALSSARAAPRFDALLAGDPQPPEVFGLYYADTAGRKRFPSRLLTSPISHVGPAPLPTGGALQHVVTRIAALGMEVVVVDVTLEEVRDVGLVVVKVLVPQLMPLTFCHAIRYLGHPRLYSAPLRLGFGARCEGDVTRDPIPYA